MMGEPFPASLDPTYVEDDRPKGFDELRQPQRLFLLVWPHYKVNVQALRMCGYKNKDNVLYRWRYLNPDFKRIMNEVQAGLIISPDYEWYLLRGATVEELMSRYDPDWKAINTAKPKKGFDWRNTPPGENAMSPKEALDSIKDMLSSKAYYYKRDWFSIISLATLSCIQHPKLSETLTQQDKRDGAMMVGEGI